MAKLKEALKCNVPPSYGARMTDGGLVASHQLVAPPDDAASNPNEPALRVGHDRCFIGLGVAPEDDEPLVEFARRA